MKLSKQERIAALIILAIVILALGGFLLVKPKFEEVASTQTTLEARKKELADAKQRQSQKGALRAQIEEEYEEGAHLADMFFPELASYAAENAFRDFIKQLDIPVVVEEVTVSEPTTTTLSMTFYTPAEVSYALKTYVTQGLEPTDEEVKLEQRKEALQSALGTSQTVGASTVEFTVSTLTIDDMLAFIDAVNDYKIQEEGTSEEVRKAVSLTSMIVEYSVTDQIYSLFVAASTDAIAREGRALLRELGFQNYEDESTPIEMPGEMETLELDIPVTFSFTDTITFLSIERMQNPKALLDAQDGIE